jgi:hypothetical protein
MATRSGKAKLAVMETTHPSFPTLSSVQTEVSRPKMTKSVKAGLQRRIARKLGGLPNIRDFPSRAATEFDRNFVARAHDRGVVMANTIQRKEIGSEGIHVRDRYVWTEIYYLDSPSDYREYLPQDQHGSPDGHSFEMLDSPRQSLRPARDHSGSLAAVFFLLAGLIGCLLLYPVLR